MVLNGNLLHVISSAQILRNSYISFLGLYQRRQ